MGLVWQADFYRRPLRDVDGQSLWELLVCDSARSFVYEARCPQSKANSGWLVEQLRLAAGERLPELIQVFRPQSMSLMAAAGQQLGVKVEPTRRTGALKQWLRERSRTYSSLDNYTGEPYDPIALDRPPPTPLPEKLWGEQWRFATLHAGDVVEAVRERPIPILEMSEFLLSIHLGLASTVLVPGVVIDGGRQSMRLARWLQEFHPVALNYAGGSPGGLVLEAGLVERWVVATFEDQEVAAAGSVYEQRKQMSRGLHFLLVQPDDSGMTYSGFWLLQAED
ncbi:MAG: Tab2/Atab2 family RNA-binding protein [Chroococcidiopsidaceae cyanobacterium CP_BM_ER_R8_30]|nr:Tab2/Atab2 family RNA-binding protein [Chroococcidiopsidaceae cyanobacterium CP_BM_ER_R8_30]